MFQLDSTLQPTLYNTGVQFITCDVACDCVCSNSSNLIGLVVGMWKRDMTHTLLHSVLTLPVASILSLRVNKEWKAN